MNFYRLASCMLIASLLFLTGCQQQVILDRDQHQESGKIITVLDNPEATTYEKSAVNTLVRLDDVRGMDWLSEETIIVDRENHDFKPEQAEGAEWYPHNLYTHSLTTGTQAPLLPLNENQGYAQVSPDKTKIFYKTNFLTSNTGKGFIFDIASGKSTAFTDIDAMDVQNGRWVDNESVVYSTIDGMIYRVYSSDSSSVMIQETGLTFPNNIAFMNDRLYYTSLKGDLMVSAVQDKPIILPVANVVWVVPSPDEKRLAIVHRIKNGNMELIVTDLQGTVLQSIAQDSQIFGAAWSPDGNKLAYVGIAPNGTARGIYVADPATGLSTELSVNIKFIADPLHWSPTGNRLMISATQPNEQNSRNEFLTYLVRVN